jgi:hypothetical protein
MAFCSRLEYGLLTCFGIQNLQRRVYGNISVNISPVFDKRDIREALVMER